MAVLLRLLLLAAAAVAAGTGCGPTAAVPGSQPPAHARQVYFDPQDLFTPDSRAVLARPSDVSSYVRWLRTRPAPGHAPERLIAALLGYRFDGSVLAVVARTVGCDSVGRVDLVRDGADLSVVAFDVRHHPECLRANHLVAVYALPRSAVPAGTRLDGAPPDTRWR
jgi:hypothetical protein